MKPKRGRPRKTAKDFVDDEGFAPNLDCLAQECGVTRQTIQNARKRFSRDAPKRMPQAPRSFRKRKLRVLRLLIKQSEQKRGSAWAIDPRFFRARGEQLFARATR